MTKKKFAVVLGLLLCIFAGVFHENLTLNGESLILIIAPEQQRMRATERLVARHSLDALPGLERALQDPDSEIQEAAVHGLMELGHEHPEAVNLLLSKGPVESDPLDGRQRFPFFTRNAITEHPQEIQGPLLGSLETLKGDRRLAALKVLQWTGKSLKEARRFVTAILEVLKAGDPDSYYPCIALLRKTPLRNALIDLESSGATNLFVQAMISVLRNNASDEQLALLTKKLDSSKRSESLVVARVLSVAKAPDSVLPMLRLRFQSFSGAPTNEDIVEARRADEHICAFLDLLGSMRAQGSPAIPELLRLLETSSDENTVAEKAAQTLALIDSEGSALVKLQDKLSEQPLNPFVLDAIEGYSKRGELVFPALIQLYGKTKSRPDKHRIVQVLTRAPVPTIARFLREIQAQGDRYEQVLAKKALASLKEQGK